MVGVTSVFAVGLRSTKPRRKSGPAAAQDKALATTYCKKGCAGGDADACEALKSELAGQ